jgi:adenylate cyclase
MAETTAPAASGTLPAVPPPQRRLVARLAAGLVRRPPPLAPRIEAAICAQQDMSERLIGWVQLVIVGTFGVLFFLAPKELPIPLWERAPVLALGAYLAFTLVRLVLSYRMRLPGWLLGLSVVADMALLILLIWSFHREYMQPPTFSLKAPTLLYVFIFIALRALRFEARYVLLAGIAAALGWGAMIAYTVWHGAGEPMLTRSYVTYLTSNAILLGAEFDKIMSILTVTAVLTLALVRARRLLVDSVREQAAASALSRFFAPEIAERIRGADAPIRAGEGQARDAAILTTDLRGFTRLSMTLPPNEVIALLVDYQRRLVPIVQKHGGSIDKFLGDGILATFGCAVPSETYARDAVSAALEIQEAARAWRAERAAAGLAAPAVGCAVTVGRVLFGAIGDETRLEFTVIGDAVNLAAKLDKHTKVEGVAALASGEAYDRALAQGLPAAPALERRRARKVEGVAEPIDVVVIG